MAYANLSMGDLLVEKWIDIRSTCSSLCRVFISLPSRCTTTAAVSKASSSNGDICGVLRPWYSD